MPCELNNRPYGVVNESTERAVPTDDPAVNRPRLKLENK